MDKIVTETELIHYSELAGALEQFRGKSIDGKIVGATHANGPTGMIELTWAKVKKE